MDTSLDMDEEGQQQLANWPTRQPPGTGWAGQQAGQANFNLNLKNWPSAIKNQKSKRKN